MRPVPGERPGSVMLEQDTVKRALCKGTNVGECIVVLIQWDGHVLCSNKVEGGHLLVLPGCLFGFDMIATSSSNDAVTQSIIFVGAQKHIRLPLHDGKTYRNTLVSLPCPNSDANHGDIVIVRKMISHIDHGCDKVPLSSY